ncbi:MAG: tetratricopeptide repeat protein [Candidatus Rifleibacteriota bacterium]
MMRRFTAGILFACLTGLFFLPAQTGILKVFAQKAELDIQEEADILYEEALQLKKQGELKKAIEVYNQAMRTDRGILAYDDAGLIEALKNDCEDRLAEDPEDVKTIETLAFVEAVCFSNYQAAIENYNKVIELVEDDNVKEKTRMLVERLQSTAEMQQDYQAEIAQDMREERLQSWAEMEKADKMAQQAAQAQEKSDQLAEMYKQKDSLANRVPQLEEELKDLKEEYDKANRLWYALKDDLYYRRRRRLEDDVEDKEKELDEAKSRLNEVEDTTARLEKEVQFQRQKLQDSPVQTYDDYQEPDQPETDSYSSSEPPQEPSANSYGSPDQDDSTQTEEPLPVVNNPDFPTEETETPADETAEEREKRLKELINNL